MSETNWNAIHRMEAAADRASDAANRMEEAARRIAYMLEDGYGGNGLKLIELLEQANTADKEQEIHIAGVNVIDHNDMVKKIIASGESLIRKLKKGKGRHDQT